MVQTMGTDSTSIAVHVQKTNHCINLDDTTVQSRAKGFWLRTTVEPIQIRKATLNMNLDSGLLLPMVYYSLLVSSQHDDPCHDMNLSELHCN